MRRHRQSLPSEEIEALLKTASNGVLAVIDSDGNPYAVPLSYAYDGKALYFHSAVAGHKIEAIKRNPIVSFCVIEQDDVLPEKFTTCYKSVVVFGETEILTDDDERRYGLHLLAGKYSPGLDSEDEINRCFNHVAVIRMDIVSMTGKEAIELTRKRANK